MKVGGAVRLDGPQKRKRFGHLSYNANQPGESKVSTINEHEYITLPKIPGPIQVKEGGYLPVGLTVNSYAYRCVAGRHYVSLTYRVPRPQERGQHARGEVGIDPNVKTALVLSDGTRYEAPHPLLKALAKIRRVQREVARCYEARKIRNGVTGTKANGPMGINERDARNRIAQIHAQIARIRRDWQNKITLSLVRRYSVIRVQTGFKGWTVKGSSRKAKFNRKALDIGLGEIVRELAYKCGWYGCKYEEVDQYFPSTQLCSHCGAKTGPKGLAELGVREWTCQNCNTTHDRDANSATNIKDFPLWSKDNSGWHRVDCPVERSSIDEAEGSVPSNGQSGSYDDQGLATLTHQSHSRSKRQKASVTLIMGEIVTDTSDVHDREQLGAAQITGGARNSEIITESIGNETTGSEIQVLNTRPSQSNPQPNESIGIL